MSLVHDYHKKFVIIISKIDILEHSQQLEELIRYVREQCRKFFGIEEPDIFPISSKLALKAKSAVAHIIDPLVVFSLSLSLPLSYLSSLLLSYLSHPLTTFILSFLKERQRALQNNLDWINSRFGSLETYILQSLNPQKRVFLKLKNPLGIAERIIKKYIQEVKERARLLETDFEVLKVIQHAMNDFQHDMKKDFKYHQEHIDNVLLRLQQRGVEWLNNKISIFNFFHLIQTENTRKEFEREVVMEFR